MAVVLFSKTTGSQATVFTSNILHRVQCQSSSCCGGHHVFRRMPQVNTVLGLSCIKAKSKSTCEVNQTSSLKDIALTSNCGRTDRANPYFDVRIKMGSNLILTNLIIRLHKEYQHKIRSESVHWF